MIEMPAIRAKKGESKDKKPYGGRPDGRSASEQSAAEMRDVGIYTVEGDEAVEDKSKQMSLGNSEAAANSKIAEFLAGLSMQDAQALERVMLNNVKVFEKPQISVGDKAMLSTLTSFNQTYRDGAWYLRHVTCSIAERRSRCTNPLRRE